MGSKTYFGHAPHSPILVNDLRNVLKMIDCLEKTITLICPFDVSDVITRKTSHA